MKILIVFLINCFACIASAQQLTIGSYNIRYDTPRDTGNSWVDRAKIVSSLIKFHDFDILGIQEALKNQLDDLNKDLPEYNRYGVGRDDGKEKGEHSAIYFKKDKFKLLNKGDFWLSQTPDTPSMGWDGKCCHRICTWVYLQEIKTGKKFYFFNAHFDHEGIQARKESSKLVLQKIKKIAGKNPVLFTGDLNGDHKSEWYLTISNSGILKDSYHSVKEHYQNNGSFNGFGRQTQATSIIDHIFHSNHFTIKKWGILTDTYHGKFPSDHFPILASVTWGK